MQLIIVPPVWTFFRLIDDCPVTLRGGCFNKKEIKRKRQTKRTRFTKLHNLLALILIDLQHQLAVGTIVDSFWNLAGLLRLLLLQTLRKDLSIIVQLLVLLEFGRFNSYKHIQRI